MNKHVKCITFEVVSCFLVSVAMGKNLSFFGRNEN